MASIVTPVKSNADRDMEATAGWYNTGTHAVTKSKDAEEKAALLRRNQQATSFISQTIVDQAIREMQLRIDEIDAEIDLTRAKIQANDAETRRLEQAQARIAPIAEEKRETEREIGVLTDVKDARDAEAAAQAQVDKTRRQLMGATGERIQLLLRQLEKDTRALEITREERERFERIARGSNISISDVNNRIEFLSRRLGHLNQQYAALLKEAGLPEDATAEDIQRRIDELKAERPGLVSKIEELQTERSGLQARIDKYNNPEFRARVSDTEQGVTLEEFWQDAPENIREKVISIETNKVALRDRANSTDAKISETAKTAYLDFEENWADVMGDIGITYSAKPLNMSLRPDHPDAPKMSRIPDPNEPQMSRIPPGGISAIKDDLGIKTTLGSARDTFGISARGDTSLADDKSGGMSTPVVTGPLVRSSTNNTLALGG